jgi:hypothetical protein
MRKVKNLQIGDKLDIDNDMFVGTGTIEQINVESGFRVEVLNLPSVSLKIIPESKDLPPHARLFLSYDFEDEVKVAL